MEISFTARGLVLTPEIKAYCESRFKELQKLFQKIIDADIVLTAEKNRFKAEINLQVKGGSLVVEEETYDIMNSLKIAFDSLKSKIKKEKAKWREKKRRSGRAIKEMSEPSQQFEQEQRIRRSSNYSLKPMTLEEALMQLKDRSRDVFMFRQQNTEKWAVVFKMKNGDFGLIEPE